MHPVTRIERVLQQLRSFTTLHAAELDGLAAEFAAAGQAELAARLRVFQGLHTQEAALIVDELTDVQAELDREDDLPSPPRGPSIPMAPRPPLRRGEGEDGSLLPLSAPERGPGGEVASVDPASI